MTSMRVRLLEADHELARALAPEALEDALPRLVVDVYELPEGVWRPRAQDYDRGGHFGLLVLDGMLLRDLVMGATRSAELICTGDLLRPFDHDGDEAPVPFDVELTAVRPTKLALLDRRFAQIAAPWPEIAAELAGRATRRSQWLAARLAINAVTRVDIRLLLMFWHFADRFGRVAKDGVVINVPLTHQVLGRLIGAQRPSVTTALKALAETGAVTRREDGCWVLHGQPPTELAHLDPRFSERGRWASSED